MSDAWNCDEVKRRILNLEAEVKALRNAVVTPHREMRPTGPLPEFRDAWVDAERVRFVRPAEEDDGPNEKLQDVYRRGREVREHGIDEDDGA